MPLFTQNPQILQETNRRPQRPIWEGNVVQPQKAIPQVSNPVPAPPRQAPTQPAPRPRPRPQPAPSSGGQGLGQLSTICGREGPVTSPLLHFGSQVRRGQLPWMAALYERGPDGLRFFCGGTLISASTVLSAAHCFVYAERNLPPSRVGVSLGRNTLDLVSDGLLGEVSVLMVHEEYSPRNYSNADIALLKLSSPVR